MFWLISVIVAFFAGSILKPAFNKVSGVWYFYYSLGQSKRNQIKLF